MKTKVLMMLSAAALLTACSHMYMFDEEAMELQTKADYAENFSTKYAGVDMNQSWDYSHKQSDYRLGGATEAKAATRAISGGFEIGDWYEVDNATLDWMHEKLDEGKDHRNLGSPFYMTVPGTEFTIVPIYQGLAGAIWNLHVVVDGVDYLVWEKINHYSLGGNDTDPGYEPLTGSIQIKDYSDDNWHNLKGVWYDGIYYRGNDLYNTDGSDKWVAPHEGEGPDWKQNIVTAVRSLPYTFKDLPVGKEMYFYLDITVTGSGNWNGKDHKMNNVGAHQSSLKQMMVALQDVPRPNNIDPSNEVMIIGCEDADLEDSDWDMNDLVLLVYGKQVPKPIKIEEGDEIEEVKTVRYMIEDLGATDDFDFNDIVLDVSEIHTISPVYTNGVVTEWKDYGTRQEAVIRHLGGTLPFTLKIGDTQLEEMQGRLGADPNTKFDVTGWDINNHNISIEVRQMGNQGVNKIGFPKAGEAPMIIAVDPSQKWMPERQSVPEDWFTVPAE